MARSAATNRFAIRNFGTALEFGVNASTNKATFPVPTSMNPGNLPAFTAAIWLFPYSLVNNTAPKPFSNDATGFPSAGWLLQLLSATPGSVQASVLSSGTAGSVTSAANALRRHEWSRVLMTWKDADLTPNLYINGILITPASSANMTGTRGTWSTGTAVIGNNTAANRVFLGLLDDYCVWNTEFTQAQVTGDFYNGTPTANLIVRYKMDEGSGTSLTDASGNSITGSITGATYSSNVVTVARSVATGRAAA